jgi:hypothetical protein
VLCFVGFAFESQCYLARHDLHTLQVKAEVACPVEPIDSKPANENIYLHVLTKKHTQVLEGKS